MAFAELTRKPTTAEFSVNFGPSIVTADIYDGRLLVSIAPRKGVPGARVQSAKDREEFFKCLSLGLSGENFRKKIVESVEFSKDGSTRHTNYLYTPKHLYWPEPYAHDEFFQEHKPHLYDVLKPLLERFARTYAEQGKEEALYELLNITPDKALDWKDIAAATKERVQGGKQSFLQRMGFGR